VSIWHELAIAVCLMMVIEGIIPFLAPQRWRQMVQYLADIDDKSMRLMGLLSMLIGTALLYIIN